MGQCFSNAGLFLPPEITFENVFMTGMGLDGVHLNYVLAIYNPNPSAQLPGTRTTFCLTKASDQTILAEGVSHQSFVIPPKQTTKVTIPIVYSFKGMGAAGKSLIQRGTTTLLLKGEVTFEAKYLPGGEVRVPYRGQGEVVMA